MFEDLLALPDRDVGLATFDIHYLFKDLTAAGSGGLGGFAIHGPGWCSLDLQCDSNILMAVWADHVGVSFNSFTINNIRGAARQRGTVVICK